MTTKPDPLAVMDGLRDLARHRLTVTRREFDRMVAAGKEPHSLLVIKADRAEYLIQQADEARAAVAELIEENAAMKELLRVQDEAMGAYRELVEHRNRQIIALGGEP